MMKWASLLLALTCIGTPLAARAVTITVENKTEQCADVNIDWFYSRDNWQRLPGQWRLTKPGAREQFIFSVQPGESLFRVGARMAPNAVCAHTWVGQAYYEMNITNVNGNYYAGIHGSGYRFSITNH